MKRMLAAVVCAVCVGPASVSAATYYVSKGEGSTPAGDDMRSCMTSQTITTPKRSLNNGLGCLAAGDTLLVRGGTYDETLINPSLASGTSWLPDAKVRVAAYAGETVWLKPTIGETIVEFSAGTYQYIEFDGINLDGTLMGYGGTLGIFSQAGVTIDHIRYQNAELIGRPGYASYGNVKSWSLGDSAHYGGYNEFINLTVHGGGSDSLHHAFYIATDNTTVRGCNIYDFTGAGVTVYNSRGQLTGVVIDANTVHDGTVKPTPWRHWGVQDTSAGVLISNNVIHNIPDGQTSDTSGIDIYGASSPLIYNNTVYNSQKGIYLDGSTDATVQNNLLYGNTVNYSTNGDSGTTEDHNARDGTNPNVVDLAGYDFHLTLNSAIAIDLGASVASVGADRDGNSRPQGSAPDIGAYEYTGVPNPPTPPPTTEAQTYRLRFRYTTP